MVVGATVVVVVAIIVVVVAGRVVVVVACAVVVVVAFAVVAVDGAVVEVACAAVVVVAGAAVVDEVAAGPVVVVGPLVVVVATCPPVRTDVGFFFPPALPRATSPISPTSTQAEIWAAFGQDRNLTQRALGPVGGVGEGFVILIPVGSVRHGIEDRMV